MIRSLLIVLLSGVLWGGCSEPRGGLPAEHSGDAGVEDGGERPPTEEECANIPDGPFEGTVLDGPIASEDLAFDDQGNVVGNRPAEGGIFKTA